MNIYFAGPLFTLAERRFNEELSVGICTTIVRLPSTKCTIGELAEKVVEALACHSTSSFSA
jgi:hypothetical protein